MRRRRAAKRRPEKLVLGAMVRLDTLRSPTRAEFVTAATGRHGIVLDIDHIAFRQYVLVELDPPLPGAARERRRLHGRIFVRPILKREES